MGMIQSQIQKALKPIEAALMKQQQEAIEENRKLMKKRMDDLEKGLKSYIDKKIEEKLK